MARVKGSQLEVLDEERDRIRALFLRFAGSNWMEAMSGQEVEDLGYSKTDYSEVFALIREPLYRGAIRHGKREIQFEQYRIVDDDIWHQANASLPLRTEPRGASERALQSLASVLDQASTIAALVRDRRIQCTTPRCKGVLTWDGVKKSLEGVTIPILRCRTCNYRTPLLTSDDLVTLNTKVRCLDCGASTLSDFTESVDPTSKLHVVTCVQCGWRVSSKNRIFTKLDKPFLAPRPDVAPGQQRLISGPTTKRKAPGRRRRKGRRASSSQG